MTDILDRYQNDKTVVQYFVQKWVMAFKEQRVMSKTYIAATLGDYTEFSKKAKYVYERKQAKRGLDKVHKQSASS